MIDTAEVFLWGTRIGIIHLNKGNDYLSFEYDRDFVRSGIEVSPIAMPLSERIYEFPALAGDAFHGAPGLLSDSLPDKFGNAVIERWLSEQGRDRADFNVIDRLCYTGKRGMGALEYKPVAGPDASIEEDINIAKMVSFASKILSDRSSKVLSSDQIGYSQLLKLGTSAGGARAKALIAWNLVKGLVKSGQIDAGDGYEYWLMKFDGVSKNGDHGLEDEVQYTLIEYAYYLMAVDCGIVMNECRIYEENGRHHFMTKRFDRDGNKKIHSQTLAALAHIDYNYPGLCSYEQAVAYMKQIGLKTSETEQFYRRMVFNVLFVNQDDHVKNISFLMNRRGEWSLAPAYDITFSYNPDNRWLKAHQMLVNGKAENITRDDLITSGKEMGLSARKCGSIIENELEILKKYKTYLSKAGIKEKTCKELWNAVKKPVS